MTLAQDYGCDSNVRFIDAAKCPRRSAYTSSAWCENERKTLNAVTIKANRAAEAEEEATTNCKYDDTRVG